VSSFPDNPNYNPDSVTNLITLILCLTLAVCMHRMHRYDAIWLAVCTCVDMYINYCLKCDRDM